MMGGTLSPKSSALHSEASEKDPVKEWSSFMVKRRRGRDESKVVTRFSTWM